MKIDITNYTKSYNIFKKEIILKYGKLNRELNKKEREEIYNLAEKKYKLKVDRTINSGLGLVFTPEMLKTGSMCKAWEREYRVPPGNWLYDKPNSCGTGCLCVDKGADKRSLDIINSIPSINVEQICDGSKEHKPRTNLTPYVAFEYKSKRPINLKSLRNLCSSAKQIGINDYGERDIRNLCTNDVMTKKETKSLRMRERELYEGQEDMFGNIINKKKKYPSVLILGKRYNDRKFWQDTASALFNIEQS